MRARNKVIEKKIVPAVFYNNCYYLQHRICMLTFDVLKEVEPNTAKVCLTIVGHVATVIGYCDIFRFRISRSLFLDFERIELICQQFS